MKKIKLSWTSEKSVKLTIVITWIFAACLVALMVSAPFIIPPWFTFSYTVGETEHESIYNCAYIVIAAFYVCCPAAVCCIVSLLKLLNNIKNEKVFTSGNIKLLRILSWCCFFVTVITFVASFGYYPFVLVFASSGFLGLILRVVKNIMAKAAELKDENDLTI